MPTCERCFIESERLYSYEYKDEDDELIKMKICWDCDFDVMNGGDITDDVSIIHLERRERAYEYDPINNVRPY